jgi:hypothetical protein
VEHFLSDRQLLDLSFTTVPPRRHSSIMDATAQPTESQEAIVSNANYHTRLLQTISDHEYVPAARKQQMTYVEDLRRELNNKKALVTELEKTTAKERKDHATLRDSTSRRFAHKIMGKKEKYEARESKEERYVIDFGISLARFVFVSMLIWLHGPLK